MAAAAGITTSGQPPTATVNIQPGMNVQAACVITPPAGALLVTGGIPAASVAVQPGMQVRAVCLVTSSGAFTSL